MTAPGPNELPELSLARGVKVAIERLARAEDGGAPALSTRVELIDDGERLLVRFDCDDPEPWATHEKRDAPLWEEEVVELFVAPGAATPANYFELEINPLGALFDARVASPHGDRREMTVDPSWSCGELRWSATIDADAGRWSARLEIPWRSLSAGDPPEVWRANFFRVDRPKNRRAEFSAWSPTLVAPADFHRPARFGFLRRVV